MLHLRLLTPSDKTDDVVRLVENTVGTTHLVVMQDTARTPVGDVVHRGRPRGHRRQAHAARPEVLLSEQRERNAENAQA